MAQINVCYKNVLLLYIRWRIFEAEAPRHFFLAEVVVLGMGGGGVGGLEIRY